MSRLLSLVGAVAALVLVVPGAAAFEITISAIEGLPTLAPGETHAHQFDVNMASTASQNILCAQEGTLTVDLSATKTDSALGLGASVDPTTVTFSIPAGAYLGGAGTTWTGTAQSATLNLEIGENLAAGHTSHTFGVKANYDGAVPANCQGDFQGASDEVDATVTLDPPEPEAPAETPTGGSETPTDEPDDGAEESPAPAGLVAVIAVALVALLRRR